jgi:hypothetical protein
MAMHPDDCDCTLYGCQLRRKGIQLSPQATPSRANSIPPKQNGGPPGHYKNILTEDRPGGYKMPILGADGHVIRHRQAQRESHKIKDRVAKARAGK